MKNPFETFVNLFKKSTRIILRPTPADFRRGVRKHRIIGYLQDPNSKQVGIFKGKITPMRRRFKGVSLTAKGK
jgi:hypothetical protein